MLSLFKLMPALIDWEHDEKDGYCYLRIGFAEIGFGKSVFFEGGLAIHLGWAGQIVEIEITRTRLE